MNQSPAVREENIEKMLDAYNKINTIVTDAMKQELSAEEMTDILTDIAQIQIRTNDYIK